MKKAITAFIAIVFAIGAAHVVAFAVSSTANPSSSDSATPTVNTRNTPPKKKAKRAARDTIFAEHALRKIWYHRVPEAFLYHIIGDGREGQKIGMAAFKIEPSDTGAVALISVTLSLDQPETSEIRIKVFYRYDGWERQKEVLGKSLSAQEEAWAENQAVHGQVLIDQGGDGTIDFFKASSRMLKKEFRFERFSELTEEKKAAAKLSFTMTRDALKRY